MSHTPGPWVGGLQITSSSGIIAHVQTKEKKLQGYSNTNSVNPCEALANAKLIAAAPELLEAMKLLTDPLYLAELNQSAEHHPFIAKARLAIAKATGEQPCGIPD